MRFRTRHKRWKMQSADAKRMHEDGKEERKKMKLPFLKHREYMKEVNGQTTIRMSDAGMCRALAALAIAARTRGYRSDKLDTAAADLSRQVVNAAVDKGTWKPKDERKAGDTESLIEAIADGGLEKARRIQGEEEVQKQI